jgi:hypothetical protein
MKNTTKLRIINWVSRVLNVKEPIVVRKQRDILMVQAEHKYPLAKLIDINGEFIKIELISKLTEELVQSKLVQFLEERNQFDNNVKISARLYVTSPIVEPTIKTIKTLEYLK